MPLWVYPPSFHKTNSKRIYLYGASDQLLELVYGDLKVQIKPLENGVFVYPLDLFLGEQEIVLTCGAWSESRSITVIEASDLIAYAYPYDAFRLVESPAKLRSVIVDSSLKPNLHIGWTGDSKYRILIPLSCPVDFSLESMAENSYRLSFMDLEQDLDWIHYLDEGVVVEPSVDGALWISTRLALSEPYYHKDALAHYLILPFDGANPVADCPLALSDASPVADRPSALSVANPVADCPSALSVAKPVPERICLDPGHGGSQRGSISARGLEEADLNLRLAKKLRARLEQEGYSVVMTREDDSDLSLAQRVEIARNSKSDLFISLHHNALPDARDPRLERGLSVHYYHATDRALAQHLLKELVRELNSSEHGLFWQNLHVLRENRYMPSILIEAGFLIHPLESDIISGEAYQESFVEGLVLALASFFDE